MNCVATIKGYVFFVRSSLMRVAHFLCGTYRKDDSDEEINMYTIVKSLPDNLFESSGVVSVDISAELTSIGGFRNCTTLKEIHLPQTITEIKPKAFFCCGKLSSINLPSGIKTVGKDAFYDTAWLESQPSGAVYINNTLYTYKDTTEVTCVTEGVFL